METVEITAKILSLFFLWVLLASPLFFISCVIGRAMKRRRITSFPAIFIFCVLVALAIAPVPTPIITIFIPNSFALFDNSYYSRLLGDTPIFPQLWTWVLVSVVITVGCVSAIAVRYLKKN